jgi:hypothetical protein
VFRDTPSNRAIAETDIPSARRSRRISAQSYTLSTCFLPSSTTARVQGKLLNIHLPRSAKSSVADDNIDVATGGSVEMGWSATVIPRRGRNERRRSPLLSRDSTALLS